MSKSHGAKSYLVECYWPGINDATVAAAAQRALRAALELRRQGHEIRFLGAILVPDDETVFCLFDGHKADVVAASQLAAVPFERVLESRRIDGNHVTERRCRF
jgi:hypothetical protein